jgi:carboxyl-terminal processing protease
VYIVLLVATLVLVVGFLINDPVFESLQQMAMASAVIHEHELFVESPDELKYGGVYGMVSLLDDYSTWHDRRADTLIRREARGHYGGFGIEIVNYDDTTLVWQVFAESPAREAGLKMGDRLLAADTVTLLGLRLDSVHTVLQTLPIPEVNLTVYRPSAGETLVIPCERRRIEVGTVRVWDRQDDLAYLAIGAFNGQTSEALGRAMDTLSSNGVKRFILDLRGNPGGLLSAAVECTELFMPQEGTVVKVTDAGPTEEVRANSGPYPTEPLVLLVDEFSASGSELMAGCLQDWDRAVVVGTPTYGKGFVQNLFPLRDRSSLRLTIGRYRTPSGRTFFKPDSTSVADTAHYTSLVHGRPLVGGGQIYPDIESAELECASHISQWARGRGTFEFAVELLARPSLPEINGELADEFWSSRHNHYESPMTDALAELLPEGHSGSAAWEAKLAHLQQAEANFDKVAASDCFLYVLTRHLVRGGSSVPLLSDPLLSTDPTLTKAVTILSTQGLYQSIITGTHDGVSLDKVSLE